MKLSRFNEAVRAEAVSIIEPCLNIRRWIEDVVDGRPYTGVEALLKAGLSSALPLTRAEIDHALKQHPRIGERAAGTNAEARLSAAEQGQMDSASFETECALRAGNIEYERRFGRVFLIRAAGRDSKAIVEVLYRRLGNTEDEELREISTQLREIASRRLQDIFTS